DCLAEPATRKVCRCYLGQHVGSAGPSVRLNGERNEIADRGSIGSHVSRDPAARRSVAGYGEDDLIEAGELGAAAVVEQRRRNSADEHLGFYREVAGGRRDVIGK